METKDVFYFHNKLVHLRSEMLFNKYILADPSANKGRPLL